MDFVASCIDEIALEGLDGITLETLWLRLDSRKPKFPLPLDGHTKKFLWSKVIASSEELEFYLLKEARRTIDLFQRFDYTDPETGIVLEQPTREEIYRWLEINDQAKGIMGSCSNYETREKITDKIRDDDRMPLMNINEATEQYGNHLIIVASQEARTLALFGPEKVNLVQQFPVRLYTLLERFGRARWEGEVSQGNNSLRVLNIDPKSLFYFKKLLLKHELISSQIFNIRLMSKQNTAGSLIHLRRFYTPHTPMYLHWLTRMSEVLKEKPNQMELLVALRKELHLKESFFKRLLGTATTMGVTKTIWMDYLEFDPNMPLKEAKTRNGVDKKARIVTLVKPYVYKDEDSAEVVNLNDDDDEEEDEDAKDLEQPTIVLEKTYIRQVAEFVRNTVGRGASEVELSRAFGCNKLCGRTLARYLERMNIAKKVLFDRGKQRVYRYVALEYADKCSELHNIKREKMKFVSKDQSSILDSTLDDSSMSTSFLDSTLSESTANAVMTNSPSQGPSQAQQEAAASLDFSAKLTNFSYKRNPLRQIKSEEGTPNYYRWLKRANIILDMLHDVHIVDQTIVFQKKILRLEQEEVQDRVDQNIGKPDKKSIMRILRKLEQQGEVKIHTTILKIGEDVKELRFFCDKSIERDNPELATYIECQRQKMEALSTIKVEKKEWKTKNDAELEFVPKDSAQLNYALLRSKTHAKELVFDSNMGKQYGVKPKCRKMEILHKYLWYLIYGYDLEQPERKEDGNLLEDLDFYGFPIATGVKDDENEESDPIPDEILSTFRVYQNDTSWKRFLPRIPRHKGFSEGWFMVGDIMLVMPVSIFLSLVRTNFKIPGLNKLLQDPIRRHLPLSQLPAKMRMALMHDRRYLFAVSDVLQVLCFLGLVAFNNREHREKHQVYVYLYKHVKIVDTIEIDRPIERRVKNYCLDSYKSVLEFWFDLQYTSINTPLVNIVEPEAHRSRYLSLTNEKFAEALAAKSVITDDNEDRTIPGDHKGAAGFDSYIFLHLRRNWSWTVDSSANSVNAFPDTSNEVSRITKEQLSAAGSKGIKFIPSGAISGPTDMHITSGASQGEKMKDDVKKKRKKKKTETDHPEGSVSNKPTKKKSTSKPLADAGKVGKESASNADLILDKSKITKVVVEGSPKKGGLGMKRKANEKSSVDTTKKETEAPLKKKKKADVLKSPSLKKRQRKKDVILDETVGEKKVDEVDNAILMKKMRDRCEWSTEEDSLLLLAEVTQRFLLFPDSRRDMLINYFFLRDLLHAQLPSFQDKTSKAIARRIKYIMKNAQTKSNVQVFVGEAIQDQELYKKFKVGKKITKAMESHKLEKIFKEAYHFLKAKFSGSGSRQKEVELHLPSDIHDLRKNFILRPHIEPALVRWKPVRSKEDICFWVLHNVVHCAMLLHDKIGRSHELFRLFSQYPEELLLAVFACMRTDGLITKIKMNNPNKTMPWNRIMLSSPRLGGYQVSQRYMYHWFIKTYPRGIFDEAPRIIAQLHQRNVDDKEETKPVVMVDQGGMAAATVALAAARMIKFETTIPDRIISIVGNALEEMSAKKSQSKAARERLSQLKNRTESDEEEEELIEKAEAERREKRKETGNEEDTNEKQVETDSHVTFQKQPNVASQSTSRPMLNMLHSCQYGMSSSQQVIQIDSNLVVNGCNVRIRLKVPPVNADDIPDEGILHILAFLKDYNQRHSWIHPKTAFYILMQIRDTFPVTMSVQKFFLNITQKFGYTEKDIAELQEIYNSLKDNEFYGRKEDELKVEMEHMLNYEKHIQILLENYVVLKVGVVDYRYVLYEYARPWLIHTFRSASFADPIKEKTEEVDVINLGDELPLPAYYPDFSSRSVAAKEAAKRRQRKRNLNIEADENVEEVSESLLTPSTKTPVDRPYVNPVDKIPAKRGKAVTANLSESTKPLKGGLQPYNCSFVHKILDPYFEQQHDDIDSKTGDMGTTIVKDPVLKSPEIRSPMIDSESEDRNIQQNEDEKNDTSFSSQTFQILQTGSSSILIPKFKKGNEDTPPVETPDENRETLTLKEQMEIQDEVDAILASSCSVVISENSSNDLPVSQASEMIQAIEAELKDLQDGIESKNNEHTGNTTSVIDELPEGDDDIDDEDDDEMHYVKYEGADSKDAYQFEKSERNLSSGEAIKDTNDEVPRPELVKVERNEPESLDALIQKAQAAFERREKDERLNKNQTQDRGEPQTFLTEPPKQIPFQSPPDVHRVEENQQWHENQTPTFAPVGVTHRSQPAKPFQIITEAHLPPMQPNQTMFTPYAATENLHLEMPKSNESSQCASTTLLSGVIVDSKVYKEKDCTDITIIESERPGERGRAMLRPGTIPQVLKRATDRNGEKNTITKKSRTEGTSITDKKKRIAEALSEDVKTMLNLQIKRKMDAKTSQKVSTTQPSHTYDNSLSTVMSSAAAVSIQSVSTPQFTNAQPVILTHTGTLSDTRPQISHPPQFGVRHPRETSAPAQTYPTIPQNLGRSLRNQVGPGGIPIMPRVAPTAAVQGQKGPIMTALPIVSPAPVTVPLQTMPMMSQQVQHQSQQDSHPFPIQTNNAPDMQPIVSSIKQEVFTQVKRPIATMGQDVSLTQAINEQIRKTYLMELDSNPKTQSITQSSLTHGSESVTLAPVESVNAAAPVTHEELKSDSESQVIITGTKPAKSRKKKDYKSTPDNPIILNVDHSVLQSVKTETSESDDEEASKRRIKDFLKKARQMKSKGKPVKKRDGSEMESNSSYESESQPKARSKKQNPTAIRLQSPPNMPSQVRIQSPQRMQDLPQLPGRPRMQSPPPTSAQALSKPETKDTPSHAKKFGHRTGPIPMNATETTYGYQYHTPCETTRQQTHVKYKTMTCYSEYEPPGIRSKPKIVDLTPNSSTLKDHEVQSFMEKRKRMKQETMKSPPPLRKPPVSVIERTTSGPAPTMISGSHVQSTQPMHKVSATRPQLQTKVLHDSLESSQLTLEKTGAPVQALLPGLQRCQPSSTPGLVADSSVAVPSHSNTPQSLQQYSLSKPAQQQQASSTSISTLLSAGLTLHALPPSDPFQKHIKSLMEISSDLKAPIKIQLPPGVEIPFSKEQVRIMSPKQAMSEGILQQKAGKGKKRLTKKAPKSSTVSNENASRSKHETDDNISTADTMETTNQTSVIAFYAEGFTSSSDEDVEIFKTLPQDPEVQRKYEENITRMKEEYTQSRMSTLEKMAPRRSCPRQLVTERDEKVFDILAKYRVLHASEKVKKTKEKTNRPAFTKLKEKTQIQVTRSEKTSMPMDSNHEMFLDQNLPTISRPNQNISDGFANRSSSQQNTLHSCIIPQTCTIQTLSANYQQPFSSKSNGSGVLSSKATAEVSKLNPLPVDSNNVDELMSSFDTQQAYQALVDPTLAQSSISCIAGTSCGVLASLTNTQHIGGVNELSNPLIVHDMSDSTNQKQESIHEIDLNISSSMEAAQTVSGVADIPQVDGPGDEKPTKRNSSTGKKDTETSNTDNQATSSVSAINKPLKIEDLFCKISKPSDTTITDIPITTGAITRQDIANVKSKMSDASPNKDKRQEPPDETCSIEEESQEDAFQNDQSIPPSEESTNVQIIEAVNQTIDPDDACPLGEERISLGRQTTASGSNETSEDVGNLPVPTQTQHSSNVYTKEGSFVNQSVAEKAPHSHAESPANNSTEEAKSCSQGEHEVYKGMGYVLPSRDQKHIPRTADQSDTSTGNKVIILPRPWKTPEGTVNRPVLRMMLAGILMHIMTVPGVTLADLITKYNLILQPVALMDLLEMLEVIGCIVKESMKKPVRRPSLFSSRRKFDGGASLSSDSEKILIFKPSLDCVIKMGMFETQIAAN